MKANCIGLLVLLALLPRLSVAQEGNRQATRVIEEVVVTATKRAESVRDVPVSISAITGDMLEEQGVQSSNEFLEQVPGVTQVDDGSTARRVTVRGVAAEAATQAATGVFIGDIPFSDPMLPRVVLDPNPFDVGSIEVLKGPQGTLFGGSALNGSIRYIPRRADLDEMQFKYFAQREDVRHGDTGKVYGMVVNLPVSEDIALRIGGHERDSAGWIDERQRNEQDVNGVEQDSLRIMLRWQPGERWDVDLMHMEQDSLYKDFNFVANEDGELHRQNTPRPSPISTDYEVQSLNVQYAFDSFSVAMVAGRWEKEYFDDSDMSRLANQNDNPPEGINQIIINDSSADTYELRFTSEYDADVPWQWVVGAFRFESELAEKQIFELAEGVTLPVSGGSLAIVPGIQGVIGDNGELRAGERNTPDISLQEQALFGEITRTFFSSLDVTLGLRKFKTSVDGTVVLSGPIFAGTLLADQNVESRNFHRVSEDGINPKLSVFHSVNDQISWYASVAKGFRFGGIQVTGSTVSPDADVPETYKSDVLWSYEVGLRTEWLEKTLIADLAVFRIDWDDPQVLLTTPEGLLAYVDNVSSAESNGAELSVQYLPPIDGLSLAFSAAYTDTRTTAEFTNGSGELFPSGTEWPLSPRWQTATSLAYRTFFGGFELSASLSHSYTTEAISNWDTQVPIFDYELFNGQLNVAYPSISWMPRFSLIVNNMKDERELVGSSFSSLLSDRTYLRPRTVTLRLSGEF